MIFSGTEKVKRYPHISGSTLKGIPAYGTVKVAGYEHLKVYKAAHAEEARLQSAGWWKIGAGSSYIYVTRHERKGGTSI